MFLDFVGFFFAGLAVNATPCVYPMLTVTVSLFKPRAIEEQQGKSIAFFRAFCYFLGIVLMYSTLGFLAASSGKIFGSALQNSWVLILVASMMFALAFSMLGFYEIRFPQAWLNRLGGLRKVSYLGLFLSGILVGVFAAPCIGPPVLALLAAVAQNGDPVFGLTAFFVFSLGLALPYLLLGTFSHLTKYLPKAGGWLIWVERILGLVLLGFGCMYLALALHWQWPFNKTPNSVWSAYSSAQTALAVSEGKPMVIDFFAEWCPGCHEMDDNIFSKDKVKEQLKTVKALRVDATNIDDPAINKLIDQYEIIGLPTVIFLDRQGQEIKKLRIEGAVDLKSFQNTWNEFQTALISSNHS